MEFNFKRLFSLVVAFVMVLSMVPFDALQVFAAGDESQTETKTETSIPANVKATLPDAATEAIQHGKDVQLAAKTAVADNYCPACDKEVTWTLLPVGTTVNKPDTAEHHYYVTGTMKSTAGNVIQTNAMPDGGTFCLLLEDKSVLDLTGRLLIYGYNKAVTFNIMGTGTIKTTNATATTTSLLSVTASKASTLNLYGGRFYSTAASNKNRAVVRLEAAEHVLNIWTDDVKIGPEEKGTSVQYNVDVRKGTFNMYGGTIQNGYCETTYQSANVYLYNDTTFNMYGGTVKDGYAIHGGNVYMCPNSTATIYGTIQGGSAVASASAVGHGGNIGGYGATVYVYGTVKDGMATESPEKSANGGNIGLGTSGEVKSSLTLGTGADISGGTTDGSGGNIYMSAGTFTMNNGHVYGGSATNGGNIYTTSAFTMHNGYIYDGEATAKGGNVCNGGTFIMHNGTIQNGTCISESGITYGGNVYNSVTFTMNNGTITDGESTSGDDIAYGGNVYSSGTFTMNNGTIKGGTVDSNSTTAATYGGNIYSSKAFTINDGVIKDGIAKQTGSKSNKDYFGGNIYAETTLTVKNAEIANGDAKRGGNIYAKGKLTMQNATLTKGTVTYLGGSLFLSAGADITDSTISEGKSTKSNGGNIFLMGGTLKLVNSDVISGQSAGYGGNIAVYTGTTLDADADSTIQNGTASSTGGNVHVLGTATIAGEVIGGKGSNGGSIYVDKGTLTVKNRVTGGETTGQGGNIHVANGGSAILDGATVSGGKADSNGLLSSNIRVSKGTLTLKGETYVNSPIPTTHSGGILLAYADENDTSTYAQLVIDPTFSGEVIYYRAGVDYSCLCDIDYTTCTAEFPGILKANSMGQPKPEMVIKYDTDLGKLTIPHVEVASTPKNPTCTETGLGEGTECDVCGEVITAQPVLPVVPHTPAAAVEENRVEATCVAEGSYDEVVYCSVCGFEMSRENKTIAVDVNAHDIQQAGAQASTCKEQGWNAYEYCSRCDYSTKELLPLASHTHGTPVEENRQEASCKETGSYEKVVYCTVCGIELSRETVDIEKTNDHTPAAAVEENRVEATCVAEGSYDEVVYCSVCGGQLSREKKTIAVDVNAHDIQQGTAQASTCKVQGWDAYEYCSRCDYSTTELQPLAEHTPAAAVEENRVEATCVAEGSYEEVVYCSVCDVELSREKKTIVIDANAHDIQQGTAQASTCTVQGWNAYEYCSRCDYSTKELLPLAEHTFNIFVETVPPTENGRGWDVYKCECGEEFHTNWTDALGTAYTINFVVPYGAQAVESETIHANYPEDLPTAANYGEYTFVGWLEGKLTGDVTEKPDVIEGKYTATANTTLYAVFSSSETTAGTEGGFKAATEIAVGDTIYLVCESKKMQLSGISNTSTKYGTGVAYTGTPNVNTYKLTVAAGSTSGTYAFKASNGQYLYWTAGNSLATNATLNANTSWKVTFNASGNATIQNAKDNARKLQWNASSPRFACYTSNQTAVQLYKEHAATPGTTTYKYITAEEFEISFKVPSTVTAPDAMNVLSGATVTLPTLENVTVGNAVNTFVGWATKSVDATTELPTMVEQNYKPTADIELVAVWSYTDKVDATDGYVKVTNQSDITTGKYVMVVNGGYAPCQYSSGWVTSANPTVANDMVTDAMGAVWTLTVSGNTVVLTDANGVSIMPKSGNNNGIASGTYNWVWSMVNGKVIFKGAGGDTTTLACNTDEQQGKNRFRSYKNTTVSGNPNTYVSEFTLYKLTQTPGGDATFYSSTLREHTHEYSSDWMQDENQHWKQCSCGEKSNVADHEYDNACDTSCNICDMTRVTEHNYVPVVTEPTFDAKGFTTYTCSVCGDSYKDNFTDAKVAKAQIGEKLYESFAEAVEKAAAGDEIVLLANADFSGYADVVINLNGYTLTGEVAATLKMNGGTLVTTKTPHTMAAPSGAKYNTTNAVITIEANGNITIVSGTVTLGESWWTGEGQTLTIAEAATFKIPADLNLNVLSTVKVEGKAEVEGTITLYIASATIESATEIANVVTNIADHKVVYENGVYKVVAKHYVAQIGNKKFEFLQDAVDAAVAGDTITLIDNVELMKGVNIRTDLTLDLNGKTISFAEDAPYYYYDAVKIYATVTITGNGTIDASSVDTYAVVVGKKSTGEAGYLTIENGTFIGTVTAVQVGAGSLTILDGNFSVADSEYGAEFLLNMQDGANATITVYGGTFVGFNPEENAAENPAVDFTADGYIGVEDGNGNYIVREGEWVARIGNKKFESLADAIAAADENATVVVIADHEVAEPVVIEKNIIIDLNGKTLTAKDIYPVIRVQGAANVTVKNGNIINANDYVFVLGSSDKATAGNLTIESGEYVGETTVVSVTKGVLTITGGKFAVSESEYGATYLINCYDANLKNGTAKIVVSGGTFVGFNPEENAAENPAVDFTADGYIGVEDGNGNYIVREGEWVAKVGEKKFETLQAAAGAAVAGDTIVLLTDVAYTGYINNAVVVDLNGKTLTGELSATLKMNGGYLVTAKYAMAGPDNSKYITTDAVMTLLPNGDMIVVSGTIELADADWWTLAGQTVTIAKDATFVIPAGKNLNVQGTVIVEGTAIVNGTATLYNTEATIEAAAGMNVVSAVAGKKVAYKSGVYCLIDENVLAWNESTGAEFETVEAALAAAKAGETVKLMGDAVEDAFFVRANIALDLNGYKLTANYVAAMPGSNVIDCSANSTGVLVVGENAFAYANTNKQLVIKTPDGYRFMDITLMGAFKDVAENEGMEYLVGASRDSDMLLVELIKQYGGAANINVQFRTVITWTVDRGTSTQIFSFKDSLVSVFADQCVSANGYSKAMWMSFINTEGLKDLTFTSQVVVLDDNGNVLQTISGQPVSAPANS